jgi:hypothetical protein
MQSGVANKRGRGKVSVVTRIALGVLRTSAAVWAQTAAQITSVIRDSSGLAIPGAEIKATQTATGVVRTTLSGADGGYVLPNLPVGPYVFEVAKPGFSKYVQSGFVLQVDTNPTVDVTLRVGSVSEQVTVEATRRRWKRVPPASAALWITSRLWRCRRTRTGLPSGNGDQPG